MTNLKLGQAEFLQFERQHLQNRHRTADVPNPEELGMKQEDRIRGTHFRLPPQHADSITQLHPIQKPPLMESVPLQINNNLNMSN